MPGYIRALVPGGTFFFTVNLLERNRALLTDHMAELRAAFAFVKEQKPFVAPGLRHSAGSFTLHLDIADRRRGFFITMAGDQGLFFLPNSPGGTFVGSPVKKRRTGHLAKAILGTHDPRRKRFRASRRLHSFQSRKTPSRKCRL